ncbi:hypothetical protein PF005_g3821 [Phytophthora fragariae]|uniref:Tudor domain-containing protein n=1 Tax=Phytophthora fragariae TaxID=53985 RepID=A0A6A3ULL5_9STRA|nr:hypothetical protein PF003_g23388 [Phytophthora fragariae]KAE8946214.1 hypothetical protein PF009_g4163 [Phytophthora fragariae]KAE9131888.1 hypothetical protein PF010_g3377 [Phytophthora fragariae]KAE9132261.1 hypothetical protein PF007_g3794 [Phytophthora fragariae]KAE9152514.1 hypothetical protein PF006_g3270 [Phytophthora fragariae]
MASSSSECSTAFEGSVVSDVSASAASEQYDDDEFDDYSDSFESDDDAASSDAAVAVASVANSSEMEFVPLSVGTRVQVFWVEENEWFDGQIQRVEEVNNKPRYFILYDDGEQAWEGFAKIRPLPAALTTTDQYDQGQQLLPLSEQSTRAIVGRKAIVYWPDEAEWFDGVVSTAQASPAALKIDYDDGDSRWEQEHTFNCILLLRSTVETPKASLSFPEVVSVPLFPPERVLYARPYSQVVSDHFQPLRIARPYRCAVDKHSESVIIARRPYSERRYLHAVHEALECSRCALHTTHHTIKVDTIAQTTLSSFHPESQFL